VSGWGEFSGDTLDAVDAEILTLYRCIIESKGARVQEFYEGNGFERALSILTNLTVEEFMQTLGLSDRNKAMSILAEYVAYNTVNVKSTICSWVEQQSAAGICNGDSGGPLVCKKTGSGGTYVFGVTSVIQMRVVKSNTTKCNKDKLAAPAIFTHVGDFDSWIQSHLNPRILGPPAGGNSCSLCLYLFCFIFVNTLFQVFK